MVESSFNLLHRSRISLIDELVLLKSSCRKGDFVNDGIDSLRSGLINFLPVTNYDHLLKAKIFFVLFLVVFNWENDIWLLGRVQWAESKDIGTIWWSLKPVILKSIDLNGFFLLPNWNNVCSSSSASRSSYCLMYSSSDLKLASYSSTRIRLDPAFSLLYVEG